MNLENDSRFLVSFRTLMEEEGGYNNIQNDKGGATKYGISLRYFRNQKIIPADINEDGVINWQDIKALTIDQAQMIVFADWWDRYSYSIFELILSRKLLSMSFNIGPATAHKCLQRAVRSCNDGTTLSIDGVLGIKTRTIISKLDQHELLSAFKSECAGYYRRIVMAYPDQEMFLDGWLNRAYR